jgi:hypothetical protein
MGPDKRVFVGIYCKIYANSFSEAMINVYATGTEIYEFLMMSAGVVSILMVSLCLGIATSGIYAAAKSSVTWCSGMMFGTGVTGSRHLTLWRRLS